MPTESVVLFYKGSKLSTVLTGHTHCTLMSANNQNLCESHSQAAKPRLLATDAQDSTVATGSDDQQAISYSPYGKDNCPPGNSLLSRYTGQSWLASDIGYLLGNGHRLFNPVLMRFYSPDDLSPFARGGINSYAYCGNDPINRVDPSGRAFRSPFKWLSGGYKSKTLAPRLDDNHYSFTKNEFKALKKSIDKRIEQANDKRYLDSNNPNRITEHADAIGKLNSQKSQVDRLKRHKDGRYYDALTIELFGDIPISRGPAGKLANKLLTPPTSESAINQLPEDWVIDDFLATLEQLRNG